MTRSAAVSMLIGVGLIGFAPVAQARDEARAHLVWRAALDGSCINQPVIERQVEQRLARAVFVAREDADIILEVAVKELGNQRRAIAIALKSQRGALWGEREIQMEADCRVLESSLVLMLSLTADIAKEEVERRIQRDRLSTTSVAPVLSASGVQGLLPRFAVGPQVGVGLYSPAVGWWELNAAWYPTQSLGSPLQAEFGAGLIGLQGCPLALHGVRASVWACAVAHGGYVVGTGRGFDSSYDQFQSIWTAGAAIRGSWEIGEPWFLAASVGGDVNLRKTRFYYETAGIRQDLFSTEPTLFFVNMGLGLRL